MNKDYKEKIIVALDSNDFKEAEKLVELLSEDLSFFKVGTELFVSSGPKIINMIKDKGGKVFLDLKLHDIPNTVAKTAKVITNYGVDIFNVHASGGLKMLQKCRELVEEETRNKGIVPPKILAVTILTSLNDDMVQNEIKFQNKAREQVLHLAALTKEAGLDGVVCSPREITLIRENIGKDFIVLTPGIRSSWAESNDQKRTLTPRQALDLGADYLVIGRPITKADDPKLAVQKILEELA